MKCKNDHNDCFITETCQKLSDILHETEHIPAFIKAMGALEAITEALIEGNQLHKIKQQLNEN